jgi:hypothetical protein
MRINGTLAAIAALAVIATGCGDSTGPKTPEFVGRYGLVTLDGATLPLVLYDDQTIKLTLTGAAITLDAKNTFTEEVRIAVETNGFPAPSQQLTCNGTFERSGNNFTMTSTESDECDASTATGVLDGNTLTVDDQGQVLVFRR